MPLDTTWTLLVRDPKYVTYDDRFLLVKDAKGKTVIISATSNGKRVWRSTKSEDRYQELRTEFAVPDSLVLRGIHKP